MLSGASCQGDKAEPYLLSDYVKWTNVDSDSIRIYQPKNEGPESSILLRQQIRALSDTVTEFEFTWLRPDSLPINRSVERYSRTNRIEFVKQSFFEIGRFKEVNEIEAEFLNKRIYQTSDTNHAFEALFTFEADKDVTMSVKAILRYELQQIDSLDASGKDCLVLTSNESIKLTFPDDRSDTTIQAISKRYFVLGQGLVKFNQQDANEFVEYQWVR